MYVTVTGIWFHIHSHFLLKHLLSVLPFYHFIASSFIQLATGWMSVYNYNYFNGPYQDLPDEYIFFDADNFDYATMDELLQQIREINSAMLEERRQEMDTVINHAWVITRQHAAQVDLTGLYWFVLLGAFILMLMLIFAKYSNFKTRIDARSQFYESLS